MKTDRRQDLAPLDYLEKYLVLAARLYFGAHTFISGINHYLLFLPDPLPMHPAMTARFMSVLVDSGLYDWCKVIEIAVGAALLLGIFVPLALVIEMPVTMIIFFVSVFMTASARTLFTGWREIFLNVGLLTAYWGYFRPLLLRPWLPLQPIWRRSTPSDGRL